MNLFLPILFIALGTVSFVLAVNNIVQEDKNIIGNWYFLILGLFSFLWDISKICCILERRILYRSYWCNGYGRYPCGYLA